MVDKSVLGKSIMSCKPLSRSVGVSARLPKVLVKASLSLFWLARLDCFDTCLLVFTQIWELNFYWPVFSAVKRALTCNFGCQSWNDACQRISYPVRDLCPKRPSLVGTLLPGCSEVYLGHLPFDVLVLEYARHSPKWADSPNSTPYQLGKHHETSVLNWCVHTWFVLQHINYILARIKNVLEWINHVLHKLESVDGTL